MNPRLVLAMASILAVTVTLCPAEDLSAEFTGILQDVLQPYGGTLPAGTSAATARAAEILKESHFVGPARPANIPNDLVAQYGKALALGTRAPNFAADMVAIHAALQKGDVPSARQAIRTLAQHAGRAEPNDAALAAMIEQLQQLQGSGGKPVEHVVVDQADHSIDLSWSKDTGKVKVDVINRKGPDGQPVRTTFTGEAKAQLDATGKSLEVRGKPDAKQPREITQEQGKKLVEQLSGEWKDQNGNLWTLGGTDVSLTATKEQSGHKIPYQGKFDLGKLTAQHIVNDPADITQAFPASIKQQLASKYHPPYKINLELNETGDKLEGTWTSLSVTYSPSSLEIESVQDPYDVPLILSRASKSTVLRIVFTDRDFKPQSEVPVYVIPPRGPGGGEVWVEVQASRDDKSFDDGKIDTVDIRVKSQSDPAGVTVSCTETGPGTRIFHSGEAVDLYPVDEPTTEEVSP